MTTRLYAADGTHLDIDEETECVATTHINESPVLRTEYLGPTPPKPVKVADPAVRRAELLAELDALDAIQPMAPAPVPVAPDPASQARIAELEAQLAAAKAGGA